jgi:arylformamidase
MDADGAIQAHVALLGGSTLAAKKNLPCELDVQFDPEDPAYTIHFFNPDSVTACTPIAIYIHGGYWTAGVLVDSGAYMAESVLSAGTTLATIQYRLSGPHRIGEIVHNVCKAVAFIAKKNPGRPLFVFGHSAGGHLSAMVLATDWADFGLSPSQVPIKGAMLISGIFDMTPILLSCVNADSSLDLTPAEVEASSPLNAIPAIKQAYQRSGVGQTKFALVAVGAHESPEFIRQSAAFQQQLSNAGIPTQYICVEAKDHFNVVEALKDSNYVLTLALQEHLGVTCGGISASSSSSASSRTVQLLLFSAAAAAAVLAIRGRL